MLTIVVKGRQGPITMYTRKQFSKTLADFGGDQDLFDKALLEHEATEDAAEKAANSTPPATESGLELVRGVFSIERNSAGAREVVFTGKLADGTDFAISRVSSTEKSWTLAAVRKALMKAPKVEVDAYIQKPNAYTTNFRFVSVSEDSLMFDLGLEHESIISLKNTVVQLQEVSLKQQESRTQFVQAQRERAARYV